MDLCAAPVNEFYQEHGWNQTPTDHSISGQLVSSAFEENFSQRKTKRGRTERNQNSIISTHIIFTRADTGIGNLLLIIR